MDARRPDVRNAFPLIAGLKLTRGGPIPARFLNDKTGTGKKSEDPPDQAGHGE